ncbi:MAG TPA: GlsB/YeaQ/YmgE family stress response membrane protein [Xanthobacteraceae bacterium]|nr:GlsB/YeaQ/YmgE family stress response membrane protein [Xanthobacteraceae bacterium]
MSVLAWIVIGLLAGWIAAKLTRAPHGLIRNLIVGLIGALVGGFLFEKLNVVVVQDFWGNLITATVGAVVFLLLWQAIRRA